MQTRYDFFFDNFKRTFVKVEKNYIIKELNKHLTYFGSIYSQHCKCAFSQGNKAYHNF